MAAQFMAGVRKSSWFCAVTILAFVAFELLAVKLIASMIGANFAASELGLGAILVTAQLAFVWVLLRLRAETVADIGLRRPRSWAGAIAAGVAIAVLLHLVTAGLEHFGYVRDLSRFAKLQGDLPGTLETAAFLLFGAGFFEEFVYRGFLMQSFAKLFGGGRLAWIAACIIQGALFGLAHLYQGPMGAELAGGLGVLFGLAFLASGRNLWILIIGHALFDSSRVIYFYYVGLPG